MLQVLGFKPSQPATVAVDAKMEGYEDLVVEIDRIVNSPYPTQLKVHKSHYGHL